MKRRNLTDAALCFILCCLICALTLFSSGAKQGAKDGIEMCGDIIIPSLLPVLIICNTITGSRLSLMLEFLFGGMFKRVFNLPKECCAAVILGLAGGYPAGAVLTCSLYENHIISSFTAKRIMTFNFCGGAAFILTAVGSVTYGSAKTGLVFYIINILSALSAAFVSRFFFKEGEKPDCIEKPYPPFADAFCNSVEKTVKSIAVMCACIILFSAIFGIISPPSFLLPLFEITNGICGAQTPRPQYTVFFLSFGGLCVHLQILPLLKRMKIKYTTFLTGRTGCSVLSFLYYKAYATIFPESDTVFSNITSPVHSFSSGGTALSLIMISGCAVLIFDIENQKLKLRRRG